MKHNRHSETPFFKLFAEVAAAPLASLESFEWNVVDLWAESYSKQPNKSEIAQPFWGALEGKWAREFPSVSLDEITSMRDWIWYGELGESAESSLPMHLYLRRLAELLLQDNGVALIPSIKSDSLFCNLAPGGLRRAARELFVWIKRMLPVDALSSAIDGAQIDNLTESTERLLIEGYGETHLHLGASFGFEHLWPCMLHRLSEWHLKFDFMSSRNAAFQHGRGLATWILRAAIIRMLLGNFLFLKHKHTDFRSFWLENLKCLELEVSYFQWSCHASLVDRIVEPRKFDALYNADEFGLLQRIYRRQLLMIGTVNVVDDLTSLPKCDPLFPVVESRLRFDHDLPERLLMQEGIRFLSHEGAGDKLFAALFWQVQRIRSLLYRHLTQPKNVPGLVWFTRYFRRISPTRRGKITTSGKICVAAEMAGYGKGLTRLEVRIEPSSNPCDLLAEVCEVASTAQAINLHSSQTPRHWQHSLYGVPIGQLLRRERISAALPRFTKQKSEEKECL